MPLAFFALTLWFQARFQNLAELRAHECCYTITDMAIQKNVSLAPFTSLRVGGLAEELVQPSSFDEVVDTLKQTNEPLWFLGFGCNSLISDQGLPGTTILWRGGEIKVDGQTLSADAGVWWDDVVKEAIKRKLWGLELMSEIPSSVGGAVFGNIAAYGQQVSDTLEWLDIFYKSKGEVVRHTKDDFDFSYRHSSLQDDEDTIILRAGFKLSDSPLHELKYDSAIAIAREMDLDHSSLEHCRQIIIETRRRAGSIYHPDDPEPERTAGSFFKNPMVSTEQAAELAKFDETGKTLERIINQSKIHGGDAHRASAAHVLLAAGFKRGQTWDKVRLHPSHVLKVATLPGATAQEVYDVVHEIINTVKTKLDITLIPEVRFLGEFKEVK